MRFPSYHVLGTLLLLPLLILTDFTAQAQSNVWVDMVPMTRRLLGSANEDVQLGIGWSSNAEEDGWRALAGLSLENRVEDSFGTEIQTNNRDFSLRFGRRWRRGENEPPKPCWIHLGLDAVFNLEHIGSSSNNVDFNSTNNTSLIESGLSGVLGISCRITEGFFFVTEARMDALYVMETVKISDSFGGDFNNTTFGWSSQLTPPLQLMLALRL
jgi:hypothetical protein